MNKFEILCKLYDNKKNTICINHDLTLSTWNKFMFVNYRPKSFLIQVRKRDEYNLYNQNEVFMIYTQKNQIEQLIINLEKHLFLVL
jgi:hypothetical protein